MTREHIEAAYGALGPEPARCYLLFGVHPGDELSVDAVAAASGFSRFAAQKLLDGLAATGLTEETTAEGVETGRYRLHPLVVAHARGLAATDPDRRWLLQRLAEWFLAGTLAAGRQLKPYRTQDPTIVFTALAPDVVVLDGRAQALAWLDRELANLVAVAAELEEEQPLRAFQLAWAMWPVFHLLRLHTVRERVDEITVRCAERLNDPSRIGEAWRRAGWGHYDRGVYAEAATLFARARDLCTRTGDVCGAATATGGMGMTALALGRVDDAYHLLRDQESIGVELGDSRAAGIAAFRVGLVHNARGVHDAALTAIERAVTLLRDGEPPDPYHLELARIEQGHTLTQLGRLDDAQAILNDALRWMTVLESPRGQAHALLRAGEHALARGDTGLARHRLISAGEYYKRVGDHRDADRVAALIVLRCPDPGRLTDTAR